MMPAQVEVVLNFVRRLDLLSICLAIGFGKSLRYKCLPQLTGARSLDSRGNSTCYDGGLGEKRSGWTDAS